MVSISINNSSRRTEPRVASEALQASPASAKVRGHNLPITQRRKKQQLVSLTFAQKHIDDGIGTKVRKGQHGGGSVMVWYRTAASGPGYVDGSAF